MTVDLADIFSGADPSDPPDDSLDHPLATVMAAIGLLANKLRQEPELSRDDAQLLIKTVLPECALFFRPMIWPEARKLAGLPELGRGRPKKGRPFLNQPLNGLR